MGYFQQIFINILLLSLLFFLKNLSVLFRHTYDSRVYFDISYIHAVQLILIRIPFLWLCMMQCYTGPVFIYEYRKTMSDSLYFLSYFHPLSLPFIPLGLIQRTSLLSICVSICIAEKTFFLFLWGLAYFTWHGSVHSIHLLANAIISFYF